MILLRNYYTLIKANFSKESFINSLKTAIACTLGLLLTYPLHLPFPQWVLISIVIVMAANARVGGALKKSYLRVIGTILGAIAASIVILLSGSNFIFINIIMLILISVFAYFACSSSDNSYLGLLGAVTVVITLNSQHPSLSMAWDRVLEITIGVIIAFIVTKFIFPMHASQVLNQSIITTFSELKDLYALFINSQINKESILAQEKHEDKIISNFSKFTTLLDEAISEKSSLNNVAAIYENILIHQRKLFRYLYVLRQSLLEIEDQQVILKSTVQKALNNAILTSFDNMINMASSLQSNKNIIISTEELHKDLFHNENLPHLKIHLKLHTFLFCIEHLAQTINELMGLLEKLNMEKQL